MTTVGYGDKTPRSIAGRCFSVAWILAGIIVFNILAGELTSVIMQAKMVNEISMAEQKVGTLDRDYDKSLVVNNGGILYGASEQNSSESQTFHVMIKNLKLGRINGFLLDKYTYRSFKENVLPLIEDREIVDFFLEGTLITDIPHSGEDLSYGVLIKYERRYEYFKPMFESNRLAFKAEISKYLNQKGRNSSVSQREEKLKKVYFEESLVYFLVPVVFIVFVGVVFEVLRKRKKKGEDGKRESIELGV